MMKNSFNFVYIITPCTLALVVLAALGACSKTNSQGSVQSANTTMQPESQSEDSPDETLEQQRIQAELEQKAKERAEALKHASSGFIQPSCLPELSDAEAKNWQCDSYTNQWVCIDDSWKGRCEFQGKKYADQNHIEFDAASQTPRVMCGEELGEVNYCRPGTKGTHRLFGKVYCGKSPAPAEDLSGYECIKPKPAIDSVWKCEGYACKCGDITIAAGTECIDGVPACDGKRVQTPIPGFGCMRKYSNDEVFTYYKCGLLSGCDLGNGTVCQYMQTLEDGKCIGGPYEDDVCITGNCPCGDDFCGFGARCESGSCVCGKDDKRKVISNIGPYFAVSYSEKKSGMGAFTCENSDCSEEDSIDRCAKAYYRCNNPDGCMAGNVHYSLNSYFGDVSIADGTFTFEAPDDHHKSCEYHIDGTEEMLTSETKCATGDCVVEKLDGHCGANKNASKNAGMRLYRYQDIDDPSVLVYDNSACVGGTRYCRGIKNSPQRIPQNEEGYICASVGHNSWENYKAWVCENDAGCLCGDQFCAKSMACIGEKCVFRDDVQGHDLDSAVPPDTSKLNPDELYLTSSRTYLDDFYANDAELIAYCGPRNTAYGTSDSYKNVSHHRDHLDALQKSLNVVPVAFDECLMRQKCALRDYIAAEDVEQYYCDHSASIFKTSDGKSVIHDYPLGLRCGNENGCKCDSSTCPAGALCSRFGCMYDSVYLKNVCGDYKEISEFDFWKNYQQFKSYQSNRLDSDGNCIEPTTEKPETEEIF